jgi:hypothetical protein
VGLLAFTGGSDAMAVSDPDASDFLFCTTPLVSICFCDKRLADKFWVLGFGPAISS